tara:strand:- start:5803 stop:7029 length:1227 start_codon:yes stop_codon:yes gene_type:complete
MTDSTTAVPGNGIKLLSLFSGCGGLDLGFCGGFRSGGVQYEKTRFRTVFANDLDPAATAVYRANRKHLNHGILEKDVALIQKKDIPDFDFMVGGFPCQPFSSAGSRRGVGDKRGGLFANAIDVFTASASKGKKPLGFLFENVRGILSSKMPDGTTVPDEIVKRMEGLGYSTNYKLLKASDYGVPSNRHRLIIVGFRKGLGYFDFDLLDRVVAESGAPNSQHSRYRLLLGSVLCDIPDAARQVDDHWRYSPLTQRMVDCVGPCLDGEDALEGFRAGIPLEEMSGTISQGRSWKNIDYEELTPRFRRLRDDPKRYRSPNNYRRFALGEINGTITASAQPEHCGITHPYLNRRFTIREIARIQSFPDSFVFPHSSIRHAYRVIGNAVPPVFGWVLAKSVEAFLSGGARINP